MANSRLRLMKVAEIIKTHTYAGHALTANRIAQLLKEDGVRSNRRTVCEDVRFLMELGLDISTYEENGKRWYYSRKQNFRKAEQSLHDQGQPPDPYEYTGKGVPMEPLIEKMEKIQPSPKQRRGSGAGWFLLSMISEAARFARRR